MLIKGTGNSRDFVKRIRHILSVNETRASGDKMWHIYALYNGKDHLMTDDPLEKTYKQKKDMCRSCCLEGYVS